VNNPVRDFAEAGGSFPLAVSFVEGMTGPDAPCFECGATDGRAGYFVARAPGVNHPGIGFAVCAACAKKGGIDQKAIDAVNALSFGGCYFLAAKHLIESDDAGARLVHGVVGWPVDNRAHAWVQHASGECWDNTPSTKVDASPGGWWSRYGTVWSANDWRLRFGPVEHASYTRQEAIALHAKHNHWGPW
jgi:hypothetical protein